MQQNLRLYPPSHSSHLAGIKVSLMRTEAVGQAKEIMEIMKDADAVLIAGGDGTVMEAVTGFMRR